MNVLQFDAIIQQGEEGSGGTWVSFPFDLQQVFGTRGRVKVHCEFDGIAYRGSIVNMGSGPCIGLLKAIREQIGKQVGDMVQVRLWRDEEPRTVEIPADLALALSQHPQASDFLESLSYSHKREYVLWITAAKLAETRDVRVEKAVELLRQQQKSPR